MGCEDFQVMLKSRESDTIAVCDFLQSHANVKLVEDAYFVYQDDSHLIEFEVRDSDGKFKVSLRFALCNPDTVDDVFLQLINSFSSQFSLDLIVKDIIDNENSVGIKGSILYKRALWKKDFGEKVEALSCDQAIDKYVLSSVK